MRTIEVEVTRTYQIEVDDNNEIVKEYNSDEDLTADCAGFKFGNGLPVISGGGVKVKDEMLTDVSIKS